ncbi:MAG: hypothetical protein M1812_005977 [Candelaria pacifica]|nr:MAG: hypothetical protein M1812_005977 [Candelaria pacifica]
MMLKATVLAVLASLSSFATAADSLDRSVCFCRGWHPHLHEWRDGFINTVAYDSPQLNHTYTWTSVCDQRVPTPIPDHQEHRGRVSELFLKSNREGECTRTHVNENTCADIDGHHFCFQPTDGKIEIDGDSYNIDLKKQGKTQIQMDCTSTCQSYHGELSDDPWEDMTTACSRYNKDGKLERAFHCETQHYPNLKEYQWPVGSFEDKE